MSLLNDLRVFDYSGEKTQQFREYMIT